MEKWFEEPSEEPRAVVPLGYAPISDDAPGRQAMATLVLWIVLIYLAFAFVAFLRYLSLGFASIGAILRQPWSTGNPRRDAMLIPYMLLTLAVHPLLVIFIVRTLSTRKGWRVLGVLSWFWIALFIFEAVSNVQILMESRTSGSGGLNNLNYVVAALRPILFPILLLGTVRIMTRNRGAALE